ncbi:MULTISPECIES: hypothetical protein [Paraburkholderia]|uniref:hypothetical protein n=1 Tax=Paraburkholderia TaxID=1822464 RepID=UPI000B3FC755|nr:hypothetical protein [Paraburkholderia caledonica]
MKLRIDGVYHHGKKENEHITMTVLEDCELHYYLVMDTTYRDDGKISNVMRHVKWLPTRSAKKGDRISLWTKKGTDAVAEVDGVTWHSCYWNSNAAIWNDDGDAAVLFEINSWKTTRAK